MPAKENKSLMEIVQDIHQTESDIKEARALGLDTDSGEQDLAKTFGMLVKKTRGIDMVIDGIDAEMASLGGLITAYKMVVKSYENKLETLKKKKKGLLGLFLAAGLVKEKKPYKTQFHSYFLKETEVTKELDLTKLPEQYYDVQIVKKPNITKIKKDLLAGIDVPGFTLETNQHIMRR